MQNEGKKKDTQTTDTKISLKDSDKDKSKTSVDDTTKIDGSTVGIPAGKEVDNALKATEGINTFHTPQKDAGDKKLSQTQKSQEVLQQRDLFPRHCKMAKTTLLILKGQRGKQTCMTFLALIKNNFEK